VKYYIRNFLAYYGIPCSFTELLNTQISDLGPLVTRGYGEIDVVLHMFVATVWWESSVGAGFLTLAGVLLGSRFLEITLCHCWCSEWEKGRLEKSWCKLRRTERISSPPKYPRRF
jgi:hypothetical protein